MYALYTDVGAIAEMLTSLDNFISYGGDVIASNAQYLGMILDIFETTMQSLNLGAVDRVAACKLAESVLLNMRGKVDSVGFAMLAHESKLIAIAGGPSHYATGAYSHYSHRH